jgi:pyrimidine operon attenuation protein / uracil phosphoribosyltransferase
MNLPMPPALIDAEAAYSHLLEELRQSLRPTDHLVGVQSKGAWIAARLHKDLMLTTPLGFISSSMHRDDYTIRGLSKADQTQLPFEVDHADIVLVDDVLFTGRTVRAILNEFFDFGRPQSVRLAVLIDRGGRQLPFQADFFAARVPLSPDDVLVLNQDAQGRFEFVLHNKKA